MKKIIYSFAFAAGILALSTSCSDYLETDTPSKADAAFVFSTTETSRAAIDGAYTSWANAAQNKVFGDGLFYAADVAGSDIERHPENFANQPGRHYPEQFYQNGTFANQYTLLSYQKENDTYAALYEVISKACIVMNLVEESEGFDEMIASGVANTSGQLYGEAVALKATAYRELIKYFGDVPYVSGKSTDHDGLVGRDSIYDVILAELQKVAPVMYRVGSIPGVDGKNYFSRTYVEGLIGRIALEAGGYQTRRGDIQRVDGNGNTLSFENMVPHTDAAATGSHTTSWHSSISRLSSTIRVRPSSLPPTPAPHRTPIRYSSNKCTCKMRLTPMSPSMRWPSRRAPVTMLVLTLSAVPPLVAARTTIPARTTVRDVSILLSTMVCSILTTCAAT